MTDKHKYFRFLAYSIEVLAFFIIQQTPRLMPEIFGEKPMLLLPILVTIAIFENEIVGLFFGLGIGILADIGLWSIIGFYSIIFTIVGFFIGILVVNFIHTNLLTTIIVSFVVIVITYGFYFLLAYVLKFYDAPMYVLIHHFISRMLYTWAMTPIFYFFNKAIAVQIRKAEE